MDPKPTCSIVEDGKPCSKRHYARDMCSAHYARWWKHGDPFVVLKPGKAKVVAPCDVDGCSRLAERRIWCTMHYQRWQKHGDPLRTLVDRSGKPRAKPKRSVIKTAAFVEEVLKMDPTGECVLWPFGKSKFGYGKISVGGKTKPAHNHVLRLAVGDPEPGQIACHAPHDVCGNRHCIAPWHLRWSTYQENNSADRRRDKTDPVGERHPLAKITEADVLAIRADPRRQVDIGKDYGITQTNVSEIKRRATWSHI